MRWKFYTCTVLFLLFMPFAEAWSATRTVCFRFQLADERTNCATSSATGAQRACNPGGYVDAVGHLYEVWDKDFSGSDEYIGTWRVDGPGRRCVTFEWENASYSKGETHPDIYLRYINKVQRTGSSNNITITAVKTNGSSHPATSWRNGTSSNSNLWVALNCQPGQNCQIIPNGSHIATHDRASERGLRIMALDTAQHTLQVFAGIMDTKIKMHYPGRSDCPYSCAVNRDEIHITANRGNHGFNVAHEVGHLVQMQEFNQDWLRNDCSRNGSGHSLTSIEYESCATSEGWADFVGVVSWYNPNNSGTVPFGWGRNFETATPQSGTCSTNGGIELQVAKAFWDLDDFNNEDGSGVASSWDDDLSYSTTSIGTGWRRFENGSGNREDGESGRDGVNMKDYYYNNDHRFTDSRFYETFLRHNCLQYQDFG